LEIGDIVKKNPDVYSQHQTVGFNDKLEVIDLKVSGGTTYIRLKKIRNHDNMYGFSQNAWFNAKNFFVIEEGSTVNGKNDIFLVFAMIPDADGSHKINLEAGAMQYTSEKEAKTEVANRLEINPETVWGIFPLAYLVKVEKPPVKFTMVWKR
jgi:hypothetical protein